MEDEDDSTLQFENGKVIAGSINNLIGHVSPTSEYYPTDDYLFAFLLSCRTFVDPVAVLKQVIERCQIADTNPGLPTTATVAPHLLLFAQQWIEQFPNDFKRSAMMEQLHVLLRYCQNLDAECVASCNKLIQMLDSRLKDIKEKKKIPKPETFKEINFVQDCSPDVVAAQLTHLELDYLGNISCDEMITMLGKDVPQNSSCSNVQKYVNWFNHLSLFVATQVLALDLGAARHLTMEYYMDVAVSCFAVGNFNSAMAVLAGLNQSSITRLHRLKERLDKSKVEHLANLERQMSPSENFKAYRTALRNAAERYTCVIPFFTLLVKDIHTTSEVKKTKIEGTDLINFEKCWEMSRHMQQFQQVQQGVCDLEIDLNVQGEILITKILSEDALSFRSYQIEEPVTDNDKKRFKTFLEKLPANTHAFE